MRATVPSGSRDPLAARRRIPESAVGATVSLSVTSPLPLRSSAMFGNSLRPQEAPDRALLPALRG
jgi:hypothetical protein